MVKLTNIKVYSILLVVFVSFLILIAQVINGQSFRLDEDVLDKAEKKYGKSARLRLVAWEDLIITDNSQTDLEKLEKTNNFFRSV